MRALSLSCHFNIIVARLPLLISMWAYMSLPSGPLSAGLRSAHIPHSSLRVLHCFDLASLGKDTWDESSVESTAGAHLIGTRPSLQMRRHYCHCS